MICTKNNPIIDVSVACKTIKLSFEDRKEKRQDMINTDFKESDELIKLK
jgi:hypothetical protein